MSRAKKNTSVVLGLVCALGAAICINLPLQAQVIPLRQAQKKINQHNWSAARQTLAKVLRKDSSNIEAQILFARWFLHPANPAYQTDSAYRHTQIAWHAFRQQSAGEKWKRRQADSTSLILLRQQIDSLAFDEAKKINSEKSYDLFIRKYVGAAQTSLAVELRDEASFLEALKQNTYAAFKFFLERYPASHRAAEASTRYEKLLFEAQTKDGKMKSYQRFVKQYPHSPYRKKAEKNIYEVQTAMGTTADFQKFITENPQSSYVNQARNILFHLLKETDEKISFHLTDSLEKITALNKLLWMPFYKNGKFGFMDTRGHETIAPRFDDVNDEYKCHATKEDVLDTSEGLVSRNGQRITHAPGGFKDLGFGFIRYGDSVYQAIHKSGVVVAGGLQRAAVAGGRFLLLKKNDRVGLWALNGRNLLPPEFNSISIVGEIIVADRNGKKNLYTTEQIAQCADGVPLADDFVFDQVKPVGNNLLVSNGSLEGMLNSKLEYVVPLARQSLQLMPFGLVRLINDRYMLEGLGEEVANRTYEKYKFYKQWIRLQTPTSVQLFDVQQKKIIEQQSDSIWFMKGLAFSKAKDTIHVYVNSATRVDVPVKERIVFVPSMDSIHYFYTQQKNKKIVFDVTTGKKLFSTDADRLESLGTHFLIITKKNKKGIIDQSNKMILPTEYNALISTDNRFVSLLKDKKFGLYDLSTKRMVKTTFGKNIVQLQHKWLIVYKDGHYGVADWQLKNIVPFQYDEIQPWSTQAIWVRLGFEWQLFNFQENRVILRQIKKINIIKDSEEENLAIVQHENYFGVVSSKSGVVLTPTFSSIENHNSEDDPVYVATKEIEEADIVVVMYYDHTGKLLRKQVYEGNEFSKLACTDD
ncbi:MAG: WG repeat-containing protein [Bacteroidetes bacterium]|nr:WG repeat-containing protein [Bacteroidota bacterium]MBS1541863.1 WG repeat-containing protein [Bacteroidota bacterium]